VKKKGKGITDRTGRIIFLEAEELNAKVNAFWLNPWVHGANGNFSFQEK